jgi:hypothetical protein
MKTIGVTLLVTMALTACGSVSSDGGEGRDLPRRLSEGETGLNATAPFAMTGESLVLDVTVQAQGSEDPQVSVSLLPVCYGPLDASTPVAEITCADDKTVLPVVVKAGQVTQICDGNKTFSIKPVATLTKPSCAQPMVRLYDFEPALVLLSK